MKRDEVVFLRGPLDGRIRELTPDEYRLEFVTHDDGKRTWTYVDLGVRDEEGRRIFRPCHRKGRAR